MEPKTPNVKELQKQVNSIAPPKNQENDSIASLVKDIEEAKKQDKVNELLSKPPRKEWVKDHPFAKGVKYIPIQVVETLLKMFYGKYRVEILREGVMANSVYCTVRLHYRDFDGEWSWHDGTGAVPMQVDQGAAATDWTKIKSSAVMQGLPAAKQFAVKDAAEQIGRIFGADLNRKDTIEFKPLFAPRWKQPTE
jgi:hypothetical protein